MVLSNPLRQGPQLATRHHHCVMAAVPVCDRQAGQRASSRLLPDGRLPVGLAQAAAHTRDRDRQQTWQPITPCALLAVMTDESWVDAMRWQPEPWWWRIGPLRRRALARACDAESSPRAVGRMPFSDGWGLSDDPADRLPIGG